MPWCPRCKTEYREGFETCADCGEALTGDEPAVARREKPSRLAVFGNLVWSVVLVMLAYTVAFGATTLYYWDAVGPASYSAFIGVLCIGGILFALLQPKPRLWVAFILWMTPLMLLAAVALVSIVRASGFALSDLADRETIEGLAYLLAFSGIGAVTATTAGRWFSGQGRRHALALLAIIVAFVSTPFAVSWLATRFYP